MIGRPRMITLTAHRGAHYAHTSLVPKPINGLGRAWSWAIQFYPKDWVDFWGVVQSMR